MSVSSALQKLANYRASNTRASHEAFENGILVLEKGGVDRLGDDAWTFLEQLALAAIDVGRLDVADHCLQRLSDKFPGSPRVDILTGIRVEATEPLDTVLTYYDELLEADSSNGAAWKRKVSVLRRAGKPEKAIAELSHYLDTFYTDVEGWLELADIYSSCNQYSATLQALSHVLLLAPQNPFYTLQFAETAYTANDLPLALKMYLVVVDMCESNSSQPPSDGLVVRAWLAIKQCARRLIAIPNGAPPTSPSNTPVPKHLNLIDELATEKVLSLYSHQGKSKDVAGKGLIEKWMSDS